ncbi:MAG: MFS transporter, partial [Armatimonadota bacterium]
SLGVILYADDLGASALKLGIVGATAFAYSISCLFTGRLSDRWGRKRVAAVGALGYGAIFLGIAHVEAIPHLMLLAVLGSAAVGFFWPPVQAWLGEQRDRRSLSSSLGIFNVCWSIGLIAGPVAATWLRTWGATTPFYFASATAAVIVLLMLLVKRDGRAAEEVEPLPVAPTAATTFLYLAWTATVATWFMGSSVKTLLPKLTRAHAVPDTTLGWLIATIAIAQTLTFATVRLFDGWQYRLTPIAALLGVGATGMVVLTLGDAPAVWAAGIAMTGVCAGMTYTSSLFYSLHGRSVGRGVRTGFHEAALGSGILLGPLLGGAAIDATGGNLYAPYVLAAAVAGLCLIAVVVLFFARAAAERAATQTVCQK